MKRNIYKFNVYFLYKQINWIVIIQNGNGKYITSTENASGLDIMLPVDNIIH